MLTLTRPDPQVRGTSIAIAVGWLGLNSTGTAPRVRPLIVTVAVAPPPPTKVPVPMKRVFAADVITAEPNRAGPTGSAATRTEPAAAVVDWAETGPAPRLKASAEAVMTAPTRPMDVMRMYPPKDMKLVASRSVHPSTATECRQMAKAPVPEGTGASRSQTRRQILRLLLIVTP